MKLTARAQEIITNFPLGFVATVDAEGRPCVSPKGTFLILGDETLAFGEIRSPQTLANLRDNPEMEVNFVDVFLRKGVRVRGRAEIIAQGTPDFDALLPRWREAFGALADRIAHIIRLPVEEAKPLTTPPYDAGATEEEMIALYKDKFGKIYP